MESLRRRSVGFLEYEGESWACFLVTSRDKSMRWHGYFSFRPKDADVEEDEVRTAEIFRERTEAEIDRKARGLGRPLLKGLLASSLHTRDQSGESSPRLRRWFRQMLAKNSQQLARGWPTEASEGLELTQLRSLYASYRLDQVCHFIALVKPEDFQEAVNRILEGRPFDFGAKDQLQFSMMVVEFIENHLPLPPFEAWAEDFLSHRGDYALYAHTLHRAGRLP
ncbi:MAG: hypothetical protein ACWGSQ_06460 [Longimicrobiales bacterium]